MKMQDKNAVQKAAKQKHKESLMAKKGKEPSLARKKPTRDPLPILLIVCEGKNTEPSYFQQFKFPSANIIGAAGSTYSLVEKAIKLKKAKKYDQVWCVFDADPVLNNMVQATKFNEAVKLAEENGFLLAYSNQAFEYWVILHLEDHRGGAMGRKYYDDKINDLLKPYNLVYDGNGRKLITKGIFDLLNEEDPFTKEKRVNLAIKRAKRNYDLFDHTNPASEESSTTVFRLVKELLKPTNQQTP